MKNIIAIILARAGSRKIPHKNIKLLLRKPLIAWTIEQAKDSKYIDRIFVSTDDREIAEISKRYGAEVPFMKPGELVP
jgi:CMP-N-acetylneuraminic acid synthetase